MTSRSRRIRISISQTWYDLLESQANRQGYTFNVQAYLNLVQGTRDLDQRWRRFDAAAASEVSHAGDAHRDIEQAALASAEPVPTPDHYKDSKAYNPAVTLWQQRERARDELRPVTSEDDLTP